MDAESLLRIDLRASEGSAGETREAKLATRPTPQGGSALPPTKLRTAAMRMLPRLPLRAALALVAGLCSLDHAEAQETDRLLTLGDLESVRGAGAPRLSPDGRLIAFHSGGAVWIMEAEPGAEPREVARGSHPTWSPSGEAVAFYGPTDDGIQVFTHSIASGRTTQRTDLDGGAVPEGLDWSRDDRLALVAQVETTGSDGLLRSLTLPSEDGAPLVLDEHSPDGYALHGLLPGLGDPSAGSGARVTEIFVHDLATDQTARLTTDHAGYSSPRWSPNGNWLVASSSEGRGTAAFESALVLVDSRTGERRTLLPASDTKKLHAAWSPDGRRIAYARFTFGTAENHGISVVEVSALGEVTNELAVLRTLAEALAWTPSGDGLVFVSAMGVTKPVIQLELETGATRIIGSAEQVAYPRTLSISRSGSVLWGESRGDRPFALMLRSPDGDAPTEVWNPNPEVLSWPLGTQRVVRWTNDHGHERTGVLILPARYRSDTRYPLIVSAYSQGTHFNSFQDITHPGYASQWFASRGYVVFFPGPRLPWHYGVSSADAGESEDVRGADGWAVTVDDVESGVDVLIERGIVDPDRMAVMGHSNGGAAAIAVVTESDRYRAAVAVAPANLNWVELALLRDDTAGRWVPLPEFTGVSVEFWEDPEIYLRGSPITRMDRVQTPLLLAVGDRDHPSFTLPTVEAYLALRSRHRSVTLLRYSEMGHSFYGPAGRDLFSRIAEFLEAHLDRGPP